MGIVVALLGDCGFPGEAAGATGAVIVAHEQAHIVGQFENFLERGEKLLGVATGEIAAGGAGIRHEHGIGWPGTALAPKDWPTTANDIIAGYKQLIERGHADGLRVIGATLTPFGNAFGGTVFDGYYNEEKEKMRLALNDFIRNSGEFDAVIDFAKVVVDPQNLVTFKHDSTRGTICIQTLRVMRQWPIQLIYQRYLRQPIDKLAISPRFFRGEILQA